MRLSDRMLDNAHIHNELVQGKSSNKNGLS